MTHNDTQAPGNSPSLPRRVKLAILFAILCCSVLSNIGIDIGGYVLDLSLIAQYVLLVAMVSSFTGELDATNAAIFVVAMPLAASSLLFNGGASQSSLLLLFALYLPFVLILSPGPNMKGAWQWTMEAFGAIAVFCAIAGILQFFAQRAITAPWLFNFSAALPHPFAPPPGYNTVISAGSFNKCNGFFFREPSSFSQFMALAIVGEWVTRKRKLRLALFGLGMVLSYSGTGILVLALASLFPLNRRTIVRLALIAVATGVVLFALGDALNLWLIVNRIGEFGSQGSSADNRFIEPLHLLLDPKLGGAWTSFLGHGPGMITRTHENYAFHDPTWAKLLFEYGVLGTALFVSLMVRSIRRFATPPEMKAAFFFLWLLTGGYLLAPERTVLIYALLAMWPKTGDEISVRKEQTDDPRYNTLPQRSGAS